MWSLEWRVFDVGLPHFSHPMQKLLLLFIMSFDSKLWRRTYELGLLLWQDEKCRRKLRKWFSLTSRLSPLSIHSTDHGRECDTLALIGSSYAMAKASASLLSKNLRHVTQTQLHGPQEVASARWHHPYSKFWTPTVFSLDHQWHPQSPLIVRDPC